MSKKKNKKKHKKEVIETKANETVETVENTEEEQHEQVEETVETVEENAEEVIEATDEAAEESVDGAEDEESEEAEAEAEDESDDEDDEAEDDTDDEEDGEAEDDADDESEDEGEEETDEESEDEAEEDDDEESDEDEDDEDEDDDAEDEPVEDKPKAKVAAAPTKSDTPGVSVLFYVFGIAFLVISLFMLFTACAYTRNYLASYDATFADMWSHSIQYVIGQFVPYLAFGVISLGIGRAIKEFHAGRQPEVPIDMDAVKAAFEEKIKETPIEVKAAPVETEPVEEIAYEDSEAGKKAEEIIKACQDNKSDIEAFASKFDDMAKEIEMLREISNIKFEETEKRQKVRLEENSRILADKEDAIMESVAKIVEYFDMDAEEVEIDEDMEGLTFKRERRFIK